MPTIPVSLGDRSYDIEIAAGALARFAESATPPARAEVAILSNQTVAPLYADTLAEQLTNAGAKVIRFNAPDGEAAKSLDVVSQAYDALAAGGLTRRGAVVAVGGGVVGDLAGFVAATWMRGVEFVQVPTTLLAMVDSSVGGKTGVNHPRAKNLIGAFHQPSRVVIDPNCLQTLPPRELRAGLAEVIKYGVIADAEFFAWLEKNIDAALALDAESLEYIIARSCELKAEVVGEDERESDAIGRRAILNYGHTAGHAFEATTRYGELLHGEAIAIGMTVAARLAILQNSIARDEGEDLLRRQTALFQRAGLPTQTPDISFETLWDAMLLDKKSRGNAVNFILPTKLGHVELFPGIAQNVVREALEGTVEIDRTS
ncbi:MAG TPA: 3-dehydroquinate synthase [Abditibacteriaceae bacterium]